MIRVGSIVCLAGDRVAQQILGTGIVIRMYPPDSRQSLDILWCNGDFYEGVNLDAVSLVL